MKISITTTPKTVRSRNWCTGEEEVSNLDIPPERVINLIATRPQDHQFIDALASALREYYRSESPVFLVLEAHDTTLRLQLNQ